MELASALPLAPLFHPSYEHKAFQICLLQSAVEDRENAKAMETLVNNYVDGKDERGCCFGNLAWGEWPSAGCLMIRH